MSQHCKQWLDDINALLHSYSQDIPDVTCLGEDCPMDEDYFLDEAYRIWSEEQNQDMPEDYLSPS